MFEDMYGPQLNFDEYKKLLQEAYKTIDWYIIYDNGMNDEAWEDLFRDYLNA